MFNTNQFSHDKENKKFVAEVSSLGRFKFKQVYPDAADEGIELISERTGCISLWVVTDRIHEEKGNYGAIMIWHLAPTPETIRKYPRLKDYIMIIFND